MSFHPSATIYLITIMVITVATTPKAEASKRIIFYPEKIGPAKT